MKKAVFWLIVLAVLLSPVAAGEWATRALGLGNPVVYTTNAAYRYAPAPNQHMIRRHGAAVTIGPEGLRGTEPWSGPAHHRILFIGDSVTWGGTNTDDAAVFADLTCKRLEERAPVNVVCGNAGVNGYGVDNMVARLRHDPAAVLADTIVVTLISVDPIRATSDLAAAHYFSKRPPGPLKGLWELAGFTAFSVAARLRWSRDAYDPRFDLAVADQSLIRLYAELRRWQEQGKAVLMVFSPHLDEFTGDPDALDAMVRRHMAGSGLPVLDLTERMRPLVGQGLYHDNVHLNEAGHALYAGWIADALAPNLVALRR